MVALRLTSATLHPTDDNSTLVGDISDAKRSKLTSIVELEDDDKFVNGKEVDEHNEGATGEEEEEEEIEELLRISRCDWSYSVPQIDVDKFMDYLLPPLESEISIDIILLSLKADGFITPDNRWTCFQTNPARQTGREDVVFAGLSEICDKSIYYASNATGREPTFVFSLLPSTTLTSCGRCAARPSGYFILKEAEDRARNALDRKDRVRWWYDIGLTTELKKSYTYEDKDANVTQVVFNMQRTMTLDPCRRFTFGVTVEDTNMRLWFVSRSTAVVSKVFNFTKEVKLLARLFLSFAFATKEEVGWDPSIRSFVRSDGIRQFRIDVGNETYETVELLSDMAAEALVSRGTRVWKVRRPGSDEHCILKDVWVDDHQQLEHVIYDMLLCDIESKYGTEIKKEVASHLLTPVAHCLVTVNGEEDHTTRTMMRGYEPDAKKGYRFRVDGPYALNSEPCVQHSSLYDAGFRSITRDLRAPFPRYVRCRKVFRRKHYRIVFREVADPLHTTKRLSEVFLVLRDSAKTLQWIHECGWVHRDISAGNLYLFDGRGIVGDLEYAKRKGRDMKRERRVGTPEFMAIETVSRSYMYCRTLEGDELNALLSAFVSAKDVHAMPDFPQPKNITPFYHNDLHDLESLWWVAIWELFFDADRSEAGMWSEDRDEKWRFAISDLFAGIEAVSDRRLFLRNSSVFEEKTAWMPDRLWKIKATINAFRQMLILKYTELEREFPEINSKALQDMHEWAREFFDGCIQFSTSVELMAYDGRVIRQSSSTGGESYVQAAQRLNLHRGGTSETPLCDSELDVSSLPLTSICTYGAGEYPGNIREPEDIDYLIPMPLLRAARYELEVC